MLVFGVQLFVLFRLMSSEDGPIVAWMTTVLDGIAAAGLYRKRYRSADPAGAPSSALASLLLELWSWGKLSSPQVQALAVAGVQDGLVAHDIVQLSQLGTGGLYPANMRRELVQKFFSQVRLPEPAMVCIPTVPHKVNPHGPECVQWMDHPLLEPARVLESLVSDYRGHLASLLSDGWPRSYWDAVYLNEDPRVLDHPLLDRENWKDRALPVMLHGDGAEFTKTHESLTSVSWSFIASTGGTWDKVFLITTFPKTAVASKKFGNGVDTWTVLWDHVASAFADLFSLDGEFFGVVMNVVGDLDYLSNDLQMPHYGSNWPCWFCNASRTEDGFNVRDALPSDQTVYREPVANEMPTAS